MVFKYAVKYWPYNSGFQLSLVYGPNSRNECQRFYRWFDGKIFFIISKNYFKGRKVIKTIKLKMWVLTLFVAPPILTLSIKDRERWWVLTFVKADTSATVTVFVIMNVLMAWIRKLNLRFTLLDRQRYGNWFWY